MWCSSLLLKLDYLSQRTNAWLNKLLLPQRRPAWPGWYLYLEAVSDCCCIHFIGLGDVTGPLAGPRVSCPIRGEHLPAFEIMSLGWEMQLAVNFLSLKPLCVRERVTNWNNRLHVDSHWVTVISEERVPERENSMSVNRQTKTSQDFQPSCYSFVGISQLIKMGRHLI